MSDSKNTRKSLRDKIFTSAKPKSKIVKFFGQEVELRQPSTGTILQLRNESRDNPGSAAAQMIINYTYVPGTNDRLFDDADTDSLLAMPFGEDMARMNEAIAELTSIDIEEAEKNSDETPGD